MRPPFFNDIGRHLSNGGRGGEVEEGREGGRMASRKKKEDENVV